MTEVFDPGNRSESAVSREDTSRRLGALTGASAPELKTDSVSPRHQRRPKKQGSDNVCLNVVSIRAVRLSLSLSLSLSHSLSLSLFLSLSFSLSLSLSLSSNDFDDSYLAETLLHSLEQAATGIGLHVNAHKTEYMCYNQTGDISTLDGTSLKLVDKFTYLGSSVSSNEKDIDTRLTKAWTAID